LSCSARRFKNTRHPARRRIVKPVKEQRHSPIELFAQQRDAVAEMEAETMGRSESHLTAQPFELTDHINRRFLPRCFTASSRAQRHFVEGLIRQGGHQVAVDVDVQRLGRAFTAVHSIDLPTLLNPTIEQQAFSESAF
jgi:hypothetical protein